MGRAAISQTLLPTTRNEVEISMGLVFMTPTSLVCKPSTFDSRVSTQWTFYALFCL